MYYSLQIFAADLIKQNTNNPTTLNWQLKIKLESSTFGAICMEALPQIQRNVSLPVGFELKLNTTMTYFERTAMSMH